MKAKRWYHNIWPLNIYRQRDEYHNLWWKTDQALNDKIIANAKKQQENFKLKADLQEIMEWSAKNGVTVTHHRAQDGSPMRIAFSSSAPKISTMEGPSGTLKSPVVEYIYSEPIKMRLVLPKIRSKWTKEKLHAAILEEMMDKAEESFTSLINEGLNEL